MKNADYIETVDKNRHANLRVKVDPNYEHAKLSNLAGISVTELGACASNYPVVFIQNPETKNYRLMVLMGLTPGENVYYSNEGWDSTFVPLNVQVYPFLIGFDDRNEASGQFATCIDRRSPLVGTTDGIALFKSDGEETDFLKAQYGLLNDIFESEKVFSEFGERLQELDLLTPLELILHPEGGEPRRITGMFTIDQRKMKQLTSEQVLEMHKSELLPFCYLVMSSVFQCHRLIQLRNRKTSEKVPAYQIEFSAPPPATPAAAQA